MDNEKRLAIKNFLNDFKESNLLASFKGKNTELEKLKNFVAEKYKKFALANKAKEAPDQSSEKVKQSPLVQPQPVQPQPKEFQIEEPQQQEEIKEREEKVKEISDLFKQYLENDLNLGQQSFDFNVFKQKCLQLFEEAPAILTRGIKERIRFLEKAQWYHPNEQNMDAEIKNYIENIKKNIFKDKSTFMEYLSPSFPEISHEEQYQETLKFLDKSYSFFKEENYIREVLNKVNNILEKINKNNENICVLNVNYIDYTPISTFHYVMRSKSEAGDYFSDPSGGGVCASILKNNKKARLCGDYFDRGDLQFFDVLSLAIENTHNSIRGNHKTPGGFGGGEGKSFFDAIYTLYYAIDKSEDIKEFKNNFKEISEDAQRIKKQKDVAEQYGRIYEGVELYEIHVIDENKIKLAQRINALSQLYLSLLPTQIYHGEGEERTLQTHGAFEPSFDAVEYLRKNENINKLALITPYHSFFYFK